MSVHFIGGGGAYGVTLDEHLNGLVAERTRVLSAVRERVDGLDWYYEDQAKLGDKPVYVIGADALAILDELEKGA